MILATHAIIGAGIVSLSVHDPALGLCLAFASHFVLDAVPHWSYKVQSTSIQPHGGVSGIHFDKDFFQDVAHIGSDGLIGILLSVLFFAKPQTLWLIIGGAIAGMLPDALQFVYSKFKHEPLIHLQHFHEWIHTKYQLNDMPLIGILSQIIFVIISVGTIKTIF